jgi:NodT family efflux transporter outer membrane factor (OMF) lipoprotein
MTIRPIVALAVFIAFLGSACSSVTEAPTLPLADHTSAYAVPVNTGTWGAAVNRQWWTEFRSSDLDAVVREALAGSYTLQSAHQRLTAEQELLRAARSAFYPELTGMAGASRQKQSAASFGLPPNAFPLPPNFNLYQVGASAGYRVDVFGLTRQQVAQRTALAEVQRFQLDAAYLTLIGNTVLQTVQLAAARTQLEALQAILQIDGQTVDYVRTARNLGAVADTDVVRAENQLATDQALQPAIEQERDVAAHALAVLVGQPPGAWSAPELNLMNLTRPQAPPVSLPSTLARERPDILAAEAQLRVAAAEVGIATAQLFPDISLSAGISTTGLRIGDLFSPAGLVWSVAAGLTQPIFDAGRRGAQRRAALALFKASAADYQQTVLEAFGQVANILQSLSHDAQLEEAQMRALNTASRAVELERINYQRGGATILDLLDAQRQHQQALLGYIRAEAQRLSNTVELYIALGGASTASSAGS